MKKYFYRDAYFSSACFCINPSAFLCLVALLPLFRFPETSLGEFPLSTSPWCLLNPISKAILITLSQWTCFLCPAFVASAALLPFINKSNITEYGYDKIFFNLFVATRWCRDKRQRKRGDGGLGSSLIRVG